MKRFAAIFFVFVLSFSSMAYAEEDSEKSITDASFTTYITIEEKEDGETLTVEEAVEMAIKNSSSLKQQSAQMELTEDEREDLFNDFLYSPSDGYSEILSLLSNDISYANSKLSYEQQKDTIALSMKSAFVSIINGERSLALSKVAPKNEMNQLIVTRKKAQLGLISDQELSQSELNYKNNEAQIAQQERSLEEAYESLYTLIGADENETFTLSMEGVYEPLNLPNSIDSYILTKISSDSTIQQKENSLYLAEQQLEMFYASGSSSYKSLENNVSTASLAVKDAKEELTEKLKSCYNEIMSLEESLEQNMEKLEMLKSDLSILNLKLEQKTATQLEVNEAEYEIASLENTIVEEIYEHMILVDKLENTSLL